MCRWRSLPLEVLAVGRLVTACSPQATTLFLPTVSVLGLRPFRLLCWIATVFPCASMLSQGKSWAAKPPQSLLHRRSGAVLALLLLFADGTIDFLACNGERSGSTFVHRLHPAVVGFQGGVTPLFAIGARPALSPGAAARLLAVWCGALLRKASAPICIGTNWILRLPHTHRFRLCGNLGKQKLFRFFPVKMT